MRRVLSASDNNQFTSIKTGGAHKPRNLFLMLSCVLDRSSIAIGQLV
jgi:hypothetical protein